MSHVTPSRFAIIGLSVFSLGVVAGSFFPGNAEEIRPPKGTGAAISAVVPETPYNTGKVPMPKSMPMTPDQLIMLESSVAAMGVLGIAGYMWRHTRQ